MPSAARRQQPLFGGKAADSGKIRTAALQTDEDGSVWLDIGRVSGVGVGSEFTAISPDSKGQTVKLRVADLEGIARSTATIVSPAGATVAAGDVFELTKWIPAEQAPLRIWLWPSNLSEQQILDAAAAGQRRRCCFRCRSGRAAVDAHSLLGRHKLDPPESGRARS